VKRLIVGVIAALLITAPAAQAADTHYTYRALLRHEWRIWTALSEVDRGYYCAMYPPFAVATWLDGMAESSVWDAPERMQVRVARRVMVRGCADWGM